MAGQNEQIIRNILTQLISYLTALSRFLNKDVKSQSNVRLGLQVINLPKKKLLKGPFQKWLDPKCKEVEKFIQEQQKYFPINHYFFWI